MILLPWRLLRRCQTRPGVSRPSGLIGFIEILLPASWRDGGCFGREPAEFIHEIPFDRREEASAFDHGNRLWKSPPARKRFVQLSEHFTAKFFRQPQLIEDLDVVHEE